MVQRQPVERNQSTHRVSTEKLANVLSNHDPFRQRQTERAKEPLETCFLSTINPVLLPVGRVELETDVATQTERAEARVANAATLTRGPCVRSKRNRVSKSGERQNAAL